MANHQDIEYRGGQELIVHLVSGLLETVKWAEGNRLRWAFTNSNAGSRYFEDFADLSDLDKIDWEAVNATQWSGRQDKKQAEFLVERCFPFELIGEIGVYSRYQKEQVFHMIGSQTKNLQIKVQQTWYY